MGRKPFTHIKMDRPRVTRLDLEVHCDTAVFRSLFHRRVKKSRPYLVGA